jgi:hypothetical protein
MPSVTHAGAEFFYPEGCMIPHAECTRVVTMPPGPARADAWTAFCAAQVEVRDRHRRMERAEAAFTNAAPLRYAATCLQSYPCQHEVTLRGTSGGRWTGTNIAAWFIEHGYPLPPHFQAYVKPT